MNMKTSITKALLSGIVATLLIAAMVAPLAAHHSFTMFDTTTQKTVTGNVKELQWTNPHIWLWIYVTNDKGVKDTYGFEGMSPNFLERRGWTRTTLKVGDKITVTFNPMRDGTNGGMFTRGTMESGKILTGSGSPSN
jgi:hypothetical protein